MRSAQLKVPSVVLADPASETKLVIDIDPPEAAPRGSFVRIRGLPPTAALTDGHAIAPGAWAVPTAALKTLRVIIPAGTTGRSEIVVALVTLEGSVIAEAKGSLVVAAARLIAPAPVPAVPKAEAPPEPRRADPPPAPVQQPVATAAPQAPPPPAAPKAEQQAALPPPTVAPSAPPAVAPKAQDPVPSAKELPPATKQKAEGLLSRGRTLLNDGNVAMARLFFERSADEGLAEGALAMGSTYDPAELRRMRVQGTQPDIAQARRWYEKARTLGSRDADTRLKDLSGN